MRERSREEERAASGAGGAPVIPSIIPTPLGPACARGFRRPFQGPSVGEGGRKRQRPDGQGGRDGNGRVRRALPDRRALEDGLGRRALVMAAGYPWSSTSRTFIVSVRGVNGLSR